MSKKSVEENIKKLIENNIVQYNCTKCHAKFDRRFNASRHYDRFHEALKIPKQCPNCPNHFKTKGEYYNHREKVHNDIKRYCRQQKDTENQTKALARVENDSEQTKTEASCNNLDLAISNMRTKCSYLSPKKMLLCKWQKTSKNSRSPLHSIENFQDSVVTTTNDLNTDPVLTIFNVNNSVQYTYVVRSVSALTNVLNFIDF